MWVLMAGAIAVHLGGWFGTTYVLARYGIHARCPWCSKQRSKACSRHCHGGCRNCCDAEPRSPEAAGFFWFLVWPALVGTGTLREVSKGAALASAVGQLQYQKSEERKGALLALMASNKAENDHFLQEAEKEVEVLVGGEWQSTKENKR